MLSLYTIISSFLLCCTFRTAFSVPWLFKAEKDLCNYHKLCLDKPVRELSCNIALHNKYTLNKSILPDKHVCICMHVYRSDGNICKLGYLNLSSWERSHIFISGVPTSYALTNMKVRLLSIVGNWIWYLEFWTYSGRKRCKYEICEFFLWIFQI